jgi:hypothetical protein
MTVKKKNKSQGLNEGIKGTVPLQQPCVHNISKNNVKSIEGTQRSLPITKLALQENILYIYNLQHS